MKRVVLLDLLDAEVRKAAARGDLGVLTAEEGGLAALQYLVHLLVEAGKSSLEVLPSL